MGVYKWELSESLREGFQDEGEKREFGPKGRSEGDRGVKALSQCVEGRDINGVRVKEMGDGEGASHGFEHDVLGC